MERTDEQARIAELTTRSSTQETAHLCLEGRLSPSRLFLEGLKRGQVSLSVEERLDRLATGCTDQFVLQVLHADEEPQSLHLQPSLRRAQTAGCQALAKVLLFEGVAHPGNREACPLRAEPNEMTRNCAGPADRYDHDVLRCQISPMPAGERLERNLIADSLDQYERPSRLCGGEGCSRCLDGRSGPLT